MTGTISKHVVVISELSNQVSKQQLLEISELEQEISCRADHSAQLQRVRKLIADERTTLKNALRLILLYALRYERHANCDTVGLLSLLKQRGGDVHVVPRMLEYAGQHARQGDLFNNVKIMDAVKLTRSLIKGLKGVENVYTQHSCLLKEILDDVYKGRPLDPTYPCIGQELSHRFVCFVMRSFRFFFIVSQFLISQASTTAGRRFHCRRCHLRRSFGRASNEFIRLQMHIGRNDYP